MCCKLLAVITTISLMLGCAPDGTNTRRTEVFNTVCRTLDERYYDPTFGGKDWKGIQNHYRSEVLGAETEEMFYKKLNQMLFQLGVSHLVVIPKDHPEWIGAPSESSDGGVGIEARIIDNQAVITSVKKGSPAYKQKLLPGMIIEYINGKTLADLKQEVLAESAFSPLDRRVLFAQKLLGQFHGPSGTEVTMTCKGDGGARNETTMKREPRPGRMQFAERVPPTFIEFEAKRIESNYGYIRFNTFHPALVDRLLTRCMRDEAKDGEVGRCLERSGRAGRTGRSPNAAATFDDLEAAVVVAGE